MKRFLAAVVSVGLVLGAVVLRSRLNEEGAGDTGGNGRVVLACDTELAQVCARLQDLGAAVEVRVVDPGVLSDEIVDLAPGEKPDIDAWLTVGPWASITDDNRAFGGAEPALAEPRTLATSPTSLVTMASDQTGEQLADCAADVTWKCVASLPGPRIGLPTPERGDGLVLLAAATSSYFGGESYSAEDLEDPSFAAWFRQLTAVSAKQPPRRQTPLEVALTQPGTFTVVGALGTEVQEATAPERFVVHDQVPPVLAPVQLTAPLPQGSAAEADTAAPAAEVLGRIGKDRLRDALVELGWDLVDGEDLRTGLPPAGVLQRLREQW